MKKINELHVIGENELLYESIQAQLNEEFQIHHILTPDVKKHAIHIALVLKTGLESPLDLVQIVLAEHPKAAIVFINDTQDFDLLRDLTKIGVTNYFVLPVEEEMLKESLNNLIETRLQGELGSSEVFKRGGGSVFTFYSGKGGSGKSLLSTVFAQTLKLESTAKVLYIDLNLQYGGAETFLGLESNRSIIDLIPVIHELNEHHLRNIAEKESHSGLDVLVSPRDAEMAEKIDQEFILRLMRASKRSYDFIIVDVPTWMEERVYTALEESEKIYYVMNLDTVAIRVLKNVETLYQQLGINAADRMELVINFAGKDNELTKKDIERFVSYPVASEIRRDLKGVQSLINQGVPLRKEPKEKKLIPVAKDVQKWVRYMLK
ncbi:CpaE family protein [Virgibacillus kekensis]|uniref:CpaE family protein n=1 Tax=Virgibacillus kekensis TaxID=202261 RepID=A0ABV9DII2_9BACI